MSRKLKSSVGNVVCGDTFWGRKTDRRLFIEKLREGTNLLLTAQRRMGKTSLMAEIERELKDSIVCLYVDLQDSENARDAIVEIGKRIYEKYPTKWEKIRSVFGRIADGIDKIEIGELGIQLRAGLTASEWADRGDRLLELLAGQSQQIVIMMDELPILIDRILRPEKNGITTEGQKQADHFMSWIRKNSIKHQGKITFVLSGSIGIGPVLHQAGISATINNFRSFELKPWTDEEAFGCLDALARQYGIIYKEGVQEAICSKLGCNIPHHIQLFFDHLYVRCQKRESNHCTIKDVNDVYQAEMLSVKGHAELMHYEERLRLVLPEKTVKLAFEMLTEAAVVGKLTQKALTAFKESYALNNISNEDLQNIIWVLKHDGYLSENKSSYVFVSKLLRDWWKARNEKFYTPINRRKAK